MKVIITGTTGMVGEGVLMECLQNMDVSEVLSISRKKCGITDPKLKELIVPDFKMLSQFQNQISGYDACFFCAGISSVGMNEEKFTNIAYDTTMDFAKALVAVNPDMTFIYVSGAGTDSTEKGRLMWARVKGKTENDLQKLGFKKVVNFRPGAMLPVPGQQHAKKIFSFLGKIYGFFAPSSIISLNDVGKAMIHASERENVASIAEIKDIKALAKRV